MNTIKRISALLLAVLLMASFSITAFADDFDGIYGYNAGEIDTNTGTIVINNGTLDTNNGFIGDSSNSESGNLGKVNNNNNIIFYNQDDGTVTNNNGDIYINKGTVDTNKGEIGVSNDSNSGNYGVVNTNEEGGTIWFNQAGGTVTKNNGTVWENYGTVKSNEGNGFVTNNVNGTVTNNSSEVYNAGNATVENNNPGGIVRNWNSGTVTNNSGTVENHSNATVVNNEMDGVVNGDNKANNNSKVTNNWGGTVNDGVTVENQYYNVDITTENATANVQSGFEDHNGASYLKDDATGTVTVKPSSGYTLAQPTLDAASGEMTAEGSENDGWTLTFTNLLKNIKLSLKGVKKTDPTPDPKPDPKPVGPVAVFSYKLKFDLDGGVMPDGETELELKCSAGQKITLPEAPTNEGFTFAGWQTEVRGKTVVFEAGAKYTVTAAKTFVALWEEN